VARQRGCNGELLTLKLDTVAGIASKAHNVLSFDGLRAQTRMPSVKRRAFYRKWLEKRYF
jgi:hypothetical protein